MSSQAPESHRPLIISISVPLLLLSIAFVSVRFYGKVILRKVVFVDDWIILAALVFCTAVTAIPLIAIRYDLGLRLADANPLNLPSMSKIVYANGMIYPTAVGLTKISICFSYLQLFPSHGNKIFCYTMITLVTLQTVLCILLSLLQCRPIEAVWDHSIQGDCLDADITVYVNAALNSASELVVFLWPIKPLWKLQLPAQQRVGLVTLFSMGVIICIVGILRIYYLSQLSVGGDFLWNGIPIWICSTLEVNLGVVCACLTSVKPVMAILFPKIFGSSQKSHSNSRSYAQHYGQRSGRARTARTQSFAFEQLSSAQRDGRSNKNRTVHQEHLASKSDGFQMADGRHLDHEPQLNNNVWVSISNDKGDDQQRVPPNAIGVSREVTVNNEGRKDSSSAAPSSVKILQPDNASEEWILRSENDSRKGSSK
ncbi:hypothetical protein MN608_11383 [Microdochium nivale]|nr:hypothetical protein MN608_11383 [Microdochium nivale]